MTTTVNGASTGNKFWDSLNDKGKSDKSDVDKTQDRFLKMLTTQLRNQDPMNPMDSAESTSQMAQISMVTGIEKLKSSMDSVASSFSTGQSFQSAAMIGRSVMAKTSDLEFSGQPVRAQVEVPEGAKGVRVTIRDENLKVVDQIDLDAKPGMQGVEWDGKIQSAPNPVGGSTTTTTVPNGKYRITAEAIDGEGQKSALNTYGFVRVNSVTVGAGGKTQLNLANNTTVSADSVSQIQ